MFYGFSFQISLLLLWALFMSVIALIMMGADKANAKVRRSRISEKTFGVITILGGFPGIIIGGFLFHHKTSKPRFWIPVFVAMILWGTLYLILYYHLV